MKVHESLGPNVAWLDRVEIEWGEPFLERLARGLEQATHFLLFWSANAADSKWVRLELHMAFIRSIEEKAIRLCVIRLDESELPLYLKPYQFLDVSQDRDPASQIVAALNQLEHEPRNVFRRRFLNRNSELGRMEAAIDYPETYLVLLNGFAGIGKESVAREGLRRFFGGAQVVSLRVSEGTGLTEFALYLNALARGRELQEGLSLEELRQEIRLSLEEVARSERFLLLTNVQHWLDEDREPLEPLRTVLDLLASMPAYRKRPLFDDIDAEDIARCGSNSRNRQHLA